MLLLYFFNLQTTQSFQLKYQKYSTGYYTFLSSSTFKDGIFVIWTTVQTALAIPPSSNPAQFFRTVSYSTKMSSDQISVNI